MSDLEKRYAGKPEQLRSLVARAKYFDCPWRGVRLYEDVSYSSTTTAEDSTVQIHHQQISTDSKKKDITSVCVWCLCVVCVI